MAGFSLYRMLRGMRSVCVPVTTTIAFSLLLIWIFVLYQPTPGPGVIQRLGWQSWSVVTMPDAAPAPASPTATVDDPVDDTVDWWNVTSTEAVDSSNLPLDIWAPLLPHDTGLSEISITKCMVEPSVAGDLCAPPTTSEEDAIRGNWVRVERNINVEAGYWAGWLNIYYRRTRRQDIDLITDLKLLSEKEQPFPAEEWHKVAVSIRSGVRGLSPLYLWYKTGKTASQMTSEERNHIVTELDIIYGEDVPWYGFAKLEPDITPETQLREGTTLTFKRGVKVPPRAPPLHFSHSGNFKILQVADLHYSVSRGLCRDTSMPCDNSDNLTNTLLAHILDLEKPNLVIFSGDQLNGQGTSWDPKSVLAKFARAVTDRNISWAAVFGNHDDESGFRKEYLMTLMQALPYNQVDPGPANVHGVGNYVLKVLSADASKSHLLTLYFLDSGSYSKGYLDFFGFFTPTAYDWIHQSQIDWFLQESASINAIERPFSPDTGKDLGSSWRRHTSSDQVAPIGKRLAKPNALMFFHIPLPETYHKADTDRSTGRPLDVGSSGREPDGNAKHNDGFFEKGVLQARESDHSAAGNALEVKVISNGHCHLTDNCRRVQGVWMCFGGGGSYSGYGKIGFDRRFRVYDISNYGEDIETYKRTENDEIVDRMFLSGVGSPLM